MFVRAKFQVTAVKTQLGYQGNSEIVELGVVNDEANKVWSKYTPQGRIEMHITNPEALEQFPVGRFFYVDFTEAPAVDPKPAG